MSDESKTTDTVAITPKVSTSSPALHTDAMWDGPRMFDQGDGTKVWISTKTEFWDYLRKHNLRMMDMQESTTGSKPEPVVKVPEFAVSVVEPMTMDEAHVYGAMTAVMKRYGLIESIWCDECFRHGRLNGCRCRVTPREIMLECRCGVAKYRPPTGTTDVVLNALANSAVVEADKTLGTVMTAAGPKLQPTTILQDMEAMIVKRYVAALRKRHKEPRLFHRDCFAGNPHNEDNAIALKVTEHQVVMVCQCRTLYHQSTKSDLIH